MLAMGPKRCPSIEVFWLDRRFMVLGSVEVLRRTLDDCSHYLDADHPLTGTVREGLRVATE
jgi:hypothetical protein